MAEMRAKLKLIKVETPTAGVQENLTFMAVGKSGQYDESGTDENSTFSKFTPMATLVMAVQNPALLGKFKEGEEFYVDFTKAD
jgi:hypothetical protein